MKKQLLFMFMLFAFISKAQQPVVFFPPGAKWHYNFTHKFYTHPAQILNRTAEYVGDTLMDNELVKIIRHPQFDIVEQAPCGCKATTTYIKQHGDTIFMKNPCLPDWQILYNFAIPVGAHWITSVSYVAINSEITYTVTVDSIKTISINNENLKRLYTTINFEVGEGYFGDAFNEILTERIGGRYLFYHLGATNIELQDYACSDNSISSLNNLLCYQDNTLGLYQHTDKACNYTTYDVGLEEFDESSGFSVYPNPVNEIINVELEMIHGETSIKIIDILGNTIIFYSLYSTHNSIDISSLPNGIYFAHIKTDKEVSARKIVVQR